MIKTAIVTGGSEGIGFAIAKKLVESNFKVFIAARTKKKLLDAASKLNNTGQCVPIVADVSSFEDVLNIVTAASLRTGHIDLLVNNAGVCHYGPFGDFTKEDVNLSIDTNLKGLIYCSLAALPFMRTGSCIVNISSTVAKNSFPNIAVYSASKAGVLAFSRSLALDLRQRKIRVRCVLPGLVNTDSNKFLGKGLSPEYVAEKVVALLSSKKQYGEEVLRVH